MKIAVTNHAVDRFRERVQGAKGFERESVRESIRKLVEEGYAEGEVRPHPLEADRRIVPFKSGDSILYLSLGPNTTTFEGDLAVVTVLFEHELTTGKVGLDVTLEDIAPALGRVAPTLSHERYAVFIGAGKSIEHYRVRTQEELKALLAKRGVSLEDPDVALYELMRV